MEVYYNIKLFKPRCKTTIQARNSYIFGTGDKSRFQDEQRCRPSDLKLAGVNEDMREKEEGRDEIAYSSIQIAGICIGQAYGALILHIFAESVLSASKFAGIMSAN